MSTYERDYSEKRDFIRMQVEAQAQLTAQGQTVVATCKDLSSTGLQLEAPTQLRLGDKVSVCIPSEHEQLAPLNIEAEVVRAVSLEDGRQSLGLTVLSMG